MNAVPLRPMPDGDAQRLRSFCAEHDYTRTGIHDVLIDNELPSPALRNLALQLDRSRPVSPLHSLIRLFLVGGSVTEAVAREHLPRWLLASCLEAGLLSTDGESYRANAILSPFQELLLATDLARDITARARPDVVLGINRTTWMLYHFTLRRRVGSVLDLGAGCGVHALCAAAHAGHVTATDLNPRATAFAAFNARLNGCDNVELLTGDTFAPVAGRRFDLIVTNPPFFITPSTRNLYCDNKGILDGYCRSLVRQAPDFLEDGGCLQMMCEWVQVKDEPWRERVASWFQGTGCDAWLLRIASHDAGRYAQNRIRETTAPAPEADQRTFDAWTAYYAEHKVEAIHAGLLILRRRSGQNWVKVEDLPPGISDPFGDVIERGLSNLDLVAAISDDDLLTARYRLVPEAQLDRDLDLTPSGWRPVSLKLRLSGPVPFEIPLEPQVAEFVNGLAESPSIGESIVKLAERVKADPNKVRPECLAGIRRLIGQGFLAPR